MVEEKQNQLVIEMDKAGVPAERQEELAGKYNGLAEVMKIELALASEVKVRGIEDVKGMKLARTRRLGLRAVRIDIEKTRKLLKKDSLAESKAIDGMANVLKFLIEPAERQMQLFEDTKRLQVDKEAEQMLAARLITLAGLGVVISDEAIAAMTDEDFTTFQTSAHDAKEGRIAEAKRIKDQAEADRIAFKEKTDEDEAERKRLADENAKLKKTEDDRLAEEQKVQAIRLAEAEQLAIDALAKQEADKEQKQRDLRTEDFENVVRLIGQFEMVDIPKLKSRFGIEAMSRVNENLNDIICELKSTRAGMLPF